VGLKSRKKNTSVEACRAAMARRAYVQVQKEVDFEFCTWRVDHGDGSLGIGSRITVINYVCPSSGVCRL
jgi:hypothetical protein